MRKYELSRALRTGTLDEIYIYTFREFGALQADAYFESLEECLTKLGENPLLGIDASNVRGGLPTIRAPAPHALLQKIKIRRYDHSNFGAWSASRAVHRQVTVSDKHDF